MREIAGQDQHVRLVARARELFMDGAVLGREKVQVGSGGNSHAFATLPPRRAPLRLAAILNWSASRRTPRMSAIPHSATSMANILSSTRLPRKGAEGFGFATSLAKRSTRRPPT